MRRKLQEALRKNFRFVKDLKGVEQAQIMANEIEEKILKYHPSMSQEYKDLAAKIYYIISVRFY